MREAGKSRHAPVAPSDAPAEVRCNIVRDRHNEFHT